MPATFACPHCGNAFRVNDADASGLLVVCPTCLQATRVAVAAAAHVPKAVLAPGATGVARRATLVVPPPSPVAAGPPPAQHPQVDKPLGAVVQKPVRTPSVAQSPGAWAQITFSCPTCESRYTVPASMAGQKAECSECSQRILVPAPPRPVPTPKTVLGKLEDVEQFEIIEQPSRRRPRKPSPRQLAEYRDAVDAVNHQRAEIRRAATVIAGVIGSIVGGGVFAAAFAQMHNEIPALIVAFGVGAVIGLGIRGIAEACMPTIPEEPWA
jgi:predicted Zn finger-like uncharacterized protein